MKCIIAIMISVVLFSCNSPRFINSPTAYNANFFKEKGDFKVAASGSFNSNRIVKEESDDNHKERSVGADFQAAYAVTDHFLVSAGGLFRKETDKFYWDELLSSNSENKVKYDRYLLDIGLGYYTAMGRSKRHFFNLTGGLGFGKASHTDIGFPDERKRTYDVNVLKYYVQPAFNFSFFKLFKMSIAPKISALNFSNIKSTYLPGEEEKLVLNNVKGNTFLLFEPSFLFQVGFKNAEWIKLDIGLNFASDPSNSLFNDIDNEVENLQSRNFLLSIGTSFYPFAGRNR